MSKKVWIARFSLVATKVGCGWRPRYLWPRNGKRILTRNYMLFFLSIVSRYTRWISINQPTLLLFAVVPVLPAVCVLSPPRAHIVTYSLVGGEAAN